MSDLRVRVTALVLTAFILGALSGWVGVTQGKPHHKKWSVEKKMERLNKKLDLNSEQVEKITKIIEAKKEKYRAIKDQIKPQMEALRKTSSNEIKALLNPEQQEKFAALEAEKKARWEKRKKQWGH